MSIMPLQYDLFEEYDEHAGIKSDMADMKDSLRRTQKRFFAENKELMTIILSQNKEIEAINKRLNNLLVDRNGI